MIRTVESDGKKQIAPVKMCIHDSRNPQKDKNLEVTSDKRRKENFLPYLIV